MVAALFSGLIAVMFKRQAGERSKAQHHATTTTTSSLLLAALTHLTP